MEGWLRAEFLFMAKLNEFHYDSLHLPPYFPELAPIDYFMFTNLKKWFSEKRLSSNEGIIAQTNVCFNVYGAQRKPSWGSKCFFVEKPVFHLKSYGLVDPIPPTIVARAYWRIKRLFGKYVFQKTMHLKNFYFNRIMTFYLKCEQNFGNDCTVTSSSRLFIANYHTEFGASLLRKWTWNATTQRRYIKV